MTEVRTASGQITEEVTAWPGVQAGPGKRGEFAFSLGRREIGHLHGDHAAHFGFPYGDAARSLIHERDIAAVAVCALTETGHGAVKHRLTGPQSLTQAEQAHTIGEAIGRPVRWEEIPREDAREHLVEAFGDASVADGALDAWAGFVSQPEPVTSTVEEITGTPATTLREWATDHAEDFR